MGWSLFSDLCVPFICRALIQGMHQQIKIKVRCSRSFAIRGTVSVHVCVKLRRYIWSIFRNWKKKTRPARGHDRPPGIVLTKKVFSHRPRKSPNPRPIHTQGAATREKGRLLTYALAWGERGDFFTLSLNSLPWEFELTTWRGASGTANQLD